jgi:hypothetical protein
VRKGDGAQVARYLSEYHPCRVCGRGAVRGPGACRRCIERRRELIRGGYLFPVKGSRVA